MSDFNPRVLAFKEELSDSCLIHYACDYGNLDFLQKMNTFHSEEFIEKQISLLTKTGRSALHLAMQATHKDITLFLLDILKKFGKDNCA